MKRIVGFLAILLFWTFAFAADPQLVLESARPLSGALSSQTSGLISQYIPGYGLQINTHPYSSTEEEFLGTAIDILNGLASTVEGLDEGDWVSVGATISGRVGGQTLLVIRIKPGQPETLEVWLNGERQ